MSIHWGSYSLYQQLLERIFFRNKSERGQSAISLGGIIHVVLSKKGDRERAAKYGIDTAIVPYEIFLDSQKRDLDYARWTIAA